jgi:hypothetical protein
VLASVKLGHSAERVKGLLHGLPLCCFGFRDRRSDLYLPVRLLKPILLTKTPGAAPGVLCTEAGSTPLDAARTTLRAIRDREEITPSRNRSYASNFVCAVA